MADFLMTHWLDILTALTGLWYIWLEYKAHIALWLVGIIMPMLSAALYYRHGLYADFGMSIYYALAAIYGYLSWKFFRRKGERKQASQPEEETEKPITHYRKRHLLPSLVCFLLAWAAIYYVLVNFTNSNVPVTDSFINALSFIGLWALARKYLEQWLIWIVVDAVSAALYAYKGIPFTAALYGLYTVIAVAGYYKWKRMMRS